MKFAVIVFPGSNSDRDAWYAASQVLGEQAELVWHKDTRSGRRRCGDPARRLRARRLPADRRDRALLADHGPRSSRFAERGGPVLGICNGFQVLLEAGLLPGAMVRNRGIKFVSRHVTVRVEQTDTPFTTACTAGQVLALPIAHGEGNYFADARRVDGARSESAGGLPLHGRERRRRPKRRTPTDRSNNIAGICNAARNVVGLMPHPERACEASLGSADGRIVRISGPALPIGCRMDKPLTERSSLACRDQRPDVLSRFSSAGHPIDESVVDSSACCVVARRRFIGWRSDGFFGMSVIDTHCSNSTASNRTSTIAFAR